MIDDRAEGTSHGSGKPSAVVYSVNETFESVVESLGSEGFGDVRTGEAKYLLERISRYHFEPYLRAAKAYAGDDDPLVSTAYSFLVFDRRCQALVFKYMGVFETQLRTQYSHWMEEEAGSLALYDESLFIDMDKYHESMIRLEDELERKARRVRSFPELLDGGRAPVNVAVECMSLGTLSQLYANTRRTDALDNVAKSFGQPKVVLVNWTKTINSARNCCAHFDCYFFKKQIPSSPKKVHGSEMSRKSPMYLAVVLEKLLSSPILFRDPQLHYSSTLALSLINEIDSLVDMYPDVLQHLGLDSDWKGHLACPEVIDASMATVLLDEENKRISLGNIGEEPSPLNTFRREKAIVLPKGSTLA